MSTSGPAAPAPAAAPNGAAPAAAQPRAAGPQNPAHAPASGPVRGPDGKFVSANPPAPQDDDPEIDLGDMKLRRSQLKSELGRAKNANRLLSEAEKRAKKAEELERSFEDKRRRWREDPDAFFTDAGIESDDEREKWAAQWIFKKRIEPEQLNEDQKARRAAEEKLAKYEAERKQREDAEAKSKAEAEDREHREAVRKELVEAIRSGQLPESPVAVRRVAAEMQRLAERGLDVDTPTVIARVKEQIRQDMAELASVGSVDDLRELMGPDAFKAHVLKVVSWAKQRVQQKAAPAKPQTMPAAKPEKPTYVAPHQWNDFIKGKL